MQRYVATVPFSSNSYFPCPRANVQVRQNKTIRLSPWINQHQNAAQNSKRKTPYVDWRVEDGTRRNGLHYTIEIKIVLGYLSGWGALAIPSRRPLPFYSCIMRALNDTLNWYVLSIAPQVKLHVNIISFKWHTLDQMSDKEMIKINGSKACVTYCPLAFYTKSARNSNSHWISM